MGQLENSEGHRKIGGGLVGIFASKYNHSVGSAIQFISHCSLIRDLILQMKVGGNK